MSRYAIVETATGRLVSESEREPVGLPAHLGWQLVDDHDDGRMWDDGARRFVARPPKVLADNPARDRFRRLQDDSRYTTFNATQRARILALLADHFGDVRYG